uniref:P-type domain-containing protein n=1 Tax=Panagrolaimus sp. JU765 TaxID=591449 RepID=A0AC34QMP2_9BILA
MVAIFVLFYLFAPNPINTQHVDKNYRIDCEPGRNQDHSYCTSIGCIEEADESGLNVPWCYFPPNTGYLAKNWTTESDKQLLLEKDAKSVKNPFGTDFQQLDFSWSELGSAVHLKISPTNQKRFRPPVPIDDSTPILSAEKLIVKSTNDPIFNFQITRQSTGQKIWDTTIGGLLFADQYIQIATILPSDKIYGFGDNVHGTLKHHFDRYLTYSMFARDQPPDSANPQNGNNIYGVQNFYLGLEPDGKAHGVFFFNSNAQEVTTGMAPSLIYRTIGGFLEFFYFPGPTPEEVIRQYTQVVGKPFLPPYWSLGFQLCRYGYTGTTEIRETLARMRAAEIPQDVQFSDIDYMDGHRDFSYDHNNFGDFPQLADELHNNYSMHLILIFDPAIEADYDAFQRAISDPDATQLVCPNQGSDSYWDNPPFPTRAGINHGFLFDKTTCMFGTTGRNTSLVYNTHNLYGWSESVATHSAIRKATGKRGVVISRSTFASSGRYAGHWLGDNTARWVDLQTSVIGAQEFNLFGIPYVGSDICGFLGDTNEELCLRWQQMGAFHSFSRNHNDKGRKLQDPAQWPTVAAAAKKANNFRYRHLPYLYSLHFAASLYGGTVVRPVFFEFPNDQTTVSIDYQFLWGPAMMIAPVVFQGATTVNVYLPNDALWYSMYDSYYGILQKNGNQTFAAPWTSLIPVFIRGGYILPRQASALTTVLARKNRFELIIALDKNNSANGELYWDDGESIPPNDLTNHNFYHFTYNFTANNAMGSLTIIKTKIASGITLPSLENIEIFGYPFYPNFKQITLNGKPLTLDGSDYSPFSKVVSMTAKQMIDLNSGDSKLVLQWQNTV